MYFLRRVPRIEGVGAVFMDILGVVVDYNGYNHAGEALYNGLVSSLSLTASPEAMLAGWVKDWSDSIVEGGGYEGVRETWVKALRKTLARFKADLGVDAALGLYELYIETVLRKSVVYRDAVSELPRLKEHGYRLGIISDEDMRVVEGVLKNSGLYGVFDMVIVSDRARGYKYRGGPFKDASRVTMLEPNQILYVGDSLTRDVAPAKQAGLRTVLIARENAGHQVTDVTPDYILPNLKTLTVALTKA